MRQPAPDNLVASGGDFWLPVGVKLKGKRQGSRPSPIRTITTGAEADDPRSGG
jgi:hypothetical protein